MREAYNVSWELIEQDYLLSWMLAGIAATPELRSMLVFKGGTALKKIYFGEYRFSQDLDFTSTEPELNDLELDRYIKHACDSAMALQSISGNRVSISYQRYRENEPHPHNQKAFAILGQFPWHREPHCRVMLE